MEHLGEKFGGLEIKGATSPGAKAIMARTGAVKLLTIPSPPLLQLVVPAPAGMIGIPLQGAAPADFGVLPPTWQRLAPVAQAGFEAPPLSLPAAAVVLPPGYIMVRDEQTLAPQWVQFDGDLGKLSHFLA